MAAIQDILKKKEAHLFTIHPEASALDAATLMNDQHVGALIVVDQDRMVGIVSERDLLRRVIAQRLEPAGTTVKQIMTEDVICGLVDDQVDEVRQVMSEKRIRHLPVVDEQGKPVGMISIGDLNAWQLDGHAQTIHYLHQYIHGAA